MTNIEKMVWQEGFAAGIEAAASLHESINPCSDREELDGDPGAGAMGAVIRYRDAIRTIPVPDSFDELRKSQN